MKNFRRIRNDLSVNEFVAEIDQHSDLWLAETGRQERLKVQQETQAIALRVGSVPSGSRFALEDSQQVDDTQYASAFPLLMRFVNNFADDIGGALGRAYIVRLRPHGRVYRHVDWGQYYARRDRYHAVLVSENSEMNCGDETIVMRPGELWYFDNKTPHQSHNPSDKWRINLIFDVMPPSS
jgi:hypothetical protein